MTIELEMTGRGDGTGVADVAVIHDGKVVSSYAVDPLGRKIEPLTEEGRMRLRHRIALAAGELWDRAMAGETLSQADHQTLEGLVIYQLDMGLRDL